MKMLSKMFSKMFNKAGKMFGLSKSAIKMLLLAIVLLVIVYSMRNYYKKFREGIDGKDGEDGKESGLDTDEIEKVLKESVDGLEQTMKGGLKEEKDEDEDKDKENDDFDTDVNPDDMFNIDNLMDNKVEEFVDYSIIEGMKHAKNNTPAFQTMKKSVDTCNKRSMKKAENMFERKMANCMINQGFKK